jgi:hypothetical protein
MGLIPAAARAQTAAPRPLQNLNFPAQISTPSGALALNGWGVRRRFGVDVYEVALYAQDRSNSPADHLTLAKRSRLAIRFLRELDNEQFTRVLLAALKERVNMTETPTMVDTMLKFSEVFSSVPVFKVGDQVTVTISGGGRMDFTINGDSKGFKPITEAALARGLLSIYVGDKPIDPELKRDMLEGGPLPRPVRQPGGPRR